MIDMLVLRCPIQDKIDVTYKSSGMPVYTDRTDLLKLDDLQVPLECSIDVDGEVDNLRHAWESIPSSFGSLAMKIFDFRHSKEPSFFVEIKASPAKIMQGHNIYGSEDLLECSMALLELLYMTYPTLSGYLNHAHWEVFQVDVTYHSKCASSRDAEQFINALQNVSCGQTRSRTGYAGTAYFGKKNSRIKKNKVYDKLKEVLNFLSSEKKRADSKVLHIYTDELIEWCEGMIRWEASLKSRWFQRRGIPTNLKKMIEVFEPRQYWKMATADIFKALEGKEMRLIKDNDIKQQLHDKFFTVSAKTGKTSFNKANAAYRTFRAIKSEGFIEAKETITSSTFYRHLEMLHDIGMSRALLQNLKGDGLSCEVIPFIRYIEVKFNEQIPPFAKEKHLRHLRLVA